MAISDWPEAERPREKLLARGPSSLSDAELLAIFLRTGVAGKTALDLARDLLVEFGGLRARWRPARTASAAAKASAKPNTCCCRHLWNWDAATWRSASSGLTCWPIPEPPATT